MDGWRSSSPTSHHLNRVSSPPPPPPTHPPPGKVYLVGSGPGSPGLLTVAAYTLLTKLATLVVSDKLVPRQILELIPSNVPVLIANKVPGNADAAQEELIQWTIKGAREGHIVVRLKQGDPFVYGRGGEEVLRLGQELGFGESDDNSEDVYGGVVVVPGITSAIAGPAMVGIPVTQRGVSDSLVVCTGVGRGGTDLADIPPYRRATTLVVLMAVARLETLISTILHPPTTTSTTTTAPTAMPLPSPPSSSPASSSSPPSLSSYPSYLPIAIIERASSPDQRLIATTLDQVLHVSELAAPHKAPAMLLIGWSVIALCGKEGNLDVLPHPSRSSREIKDEDDISRVQNWLRGRKYVELHGLPKSWLHVEQAVANAFSIKQ